MKRPQVALSSIAVNKGLVGGPFGSSLVSKDYEQDGIPVIRGTNLNVGSTVGGEFAFVSEDKFQRDLKRNSAQPGDLVFTQRGTLGQVAVVPSEPFSTYVISQSQMRLRIDRSLADPRYVYFACNSPSFLRQINDNAITTGVPHINLGILGRLTIPLPDLSEQRAIAEVLGALDDKIAANTKLGHAVEAFGSAKFTRLGLDFEPTGEGILLDDLFHLNPRRTVSSDRPTIIDMKALPTASPLVEEWTTGSRKGGARFKNGDTLVARITPCLENRKTAFVDFLDDEEVGIGSTEFIIMRSKNNLPLGLSYFMAISDRFRDFAIQNLVGTSGRQRVAAADLARHTLSPVDVSELQEFGKWADENLTFLGSLREENRTLAAMRNALLPQLMSGKLRVEDAEKVVEDSL